MLLESSKSWNTSQETTVLTSIMANWAFILRIIKLKVCLSILKLSRAPLIPWKIRVMHRVQNKRKLKTSHIILMIIDDRIQLFSKTPHKTRKTLTNRKSNIIKGTTENNYKSIYQISNLQNNKSHHILIPWGIRWTFIVKRRSRILSLILMGSLPNHSKFKPKDIVLTKSIKEFQPRMLLHHQTVRTTKKLRLQIASTATIE